MVPAAVGEISLRFTRSDHEMTLEIEVPKGATAEAALPDMLVPMKDQRCNGTSFPGTVTLSAGRHRLTALFA
jgi:hypothetical protein